MLVGNILAVSWPRLARRPSVRRIGAFHYIFRKKFLAISMDARKAEADGVSIKFWTFFSTRLLDSL